MIKINRSSKPIFCFPGIINVIVICVYHNLMIAAIHFFFKQRKKTMEIEKKIGGNL